MGLFKKNMGHTLTNHCFIVITRVFTATEGPTKGWVSGLPQRGKYPPLAESKGSNLGTLIASYRLCVYIYILLYI